MPLSIIGPKLYGIGFFEVSEIVRLLSVSISGQNKCLFATSTESLQWIGILIAKKIALYMDDGHPYALKLANFKVERGTKRYIY